MAIRRTLVTRKGNMNQTFDPIEYGRMLIDLGTALLQGRLQIVGGEQLTPSPQIPNRELAHDYAPAAQNGATDVEPRIMGSDLARPGSRGVWMARKGYSVVVPKKGQLDMSGVTPAGFRLVEYLTRHPGQSAATIAGELGLSRKTVENLLSILRQRHLIQVADLKR